jgi:hypothetical protein
MSRVGVPTRAMDLHARRDLAVPSFLAERSFVRGLQDEFTLAESMGVRASHNWPITLEITP